MDVDDIDRRVLAALLANGRASGSDLGDVADVGPTTASWRRKTLENEGVIEAYQPRIDYEALGYDVTAILTLHVDTSVRDAVVADLSERDRLVTVYEVSGPGDVVAIGHFRDYADLDAFLRQLRDDDRIRHVRADPATQVKHQQVPPTED